MNVADIVVAILGKKGVLMDTKNVDMEIDIPESILKVDALDKTNKITIRLKAENVKISIEKD
jgi:hypothetical protein